MMVGITMMPQLCADSWDSLDQVLICSVKCKAEVVMYWAKDHVHQGAERVGGAQANTKVGPHKLDCVRGVWGHAPRKF